MTRGSNAVQRAFNEFGRNASFEKKSGNWSRASGEVISVLNLQKSQYAPRYYLNHGFWLRQLGDEAYPNVERSHIVSRLEDLLPDAEIRIGELLNLEYEMPDEQRIPELVALLETGLLPLINEGSSVAGLRSMLDQGILAGSAVTAPARKVLSEIA